MQTRFHKIIAVIAGLLAAMPSISVGQSDNLEELRKQLEKVEQQSDQKILTKKQNESSISVLAEKINGLKSRADLSLSEQNRLDELLKQSIVLKKKNDRINTELDKIRHTKTTLVTEMIGLLEDRLLELGDAVRDKPNKELSAQYLKTLNEKKALEQELDGWGGAISPSIRTSPDDDYETLYLKADFLADQADKLSAYLTRLDAKIEELEDEKEIRELTDNFMDQVFIFDEDKELKFSAGIGSGNVNSETNPDGNGNTEVDGLTEGGTAGGHSSSIFEGDFKLDEIGTTVNLGKESILNNLDQVSVSSAEGMEHLIGQLRTESKLLSGELSLMKQRAKALYQMALELENELNK